LDSAVPDGQHTTFAQITDELLGEQRIALGALNQGTSQCVGQLGQAKSGENQPPDVRRRQWFQSELRDIRLPQPFWLMLGPLTEQNIPPPERWNLVVSNPPHFVDQYEGDIRAHDPEWQIHRAFFKTVSSYLAEDGVIVLQENNRGSTVETFRFMIERSGFNILFKHRDSPNLTTESSFYFIGIGRRGAPRPNWT
jgi:hypothetical protein